MYKIQENKSNVKVNLHENFGTELINWKVLTQYIVKIYVLFNIIIFNHQILFKLFFLR